MAAFRDTLAYAHQAGLMTIADVKRNDIGSTASAYAKGYLVRALLSRAISSPSTAISAATASSLS